MPTERRQFLEAAFLGATATLTPSRSKAEAAKLGMPGPYPGRVIAVEHPACLVSGAYRADPIRRMVERGMQELTGAPTWQDAQRTMFGKGDVVRIKVSPVGGPKLSSDATVLHSILDGLNAAGVSNRTIIVFSRYRAEILEAGIDQ